MRYTVYRQGPEEMSTPSNYPLNDSPWTDVGSIESDRKPQDLSWPWAVKQATGENMEAENDRGVWYIVLPEGRTP